MQGNYFRRTRLVTRSTCTTGLVTRSTRSICLPTRSAHLSICFLLLVLVFPLVVSVCFIINIILAINSRAVFIVRYGVGIKSWTKMELEELYRKRRKLMAMHSTLRHVDRLYLLRCEGERSLIGLEDCVQVADKAFRRT